MFINHTMFATGDQALTTSGRLTTPFPKINITTNRCAANTLKRAIKWLMGNAIAEAESRGDNFNQIQFQASQNCPTQSDKESAEMYLFGDFVFEIPRPFLKPLTGK